MHISTHVTSKNVHVYVLNDHLIGGSKARAILPYIRTHLARGIEEFVYVGPTGGAGFMTLGVGVAELGARATFFLCGPPNHRVDKVRSLGLAVRDRFRNLQDARKVCEAYLSARSAGRTMEVPFGIADDLFVEMMVASISKDVERLTPPTRVWSAGGSGCMLKILKEVWPDATFIVVEVGKFLNGWGLYEPPGEVWRRDPVHVPRATSPDLKTIAYHHPLRFPEAARVVPPYPSLLNYDAKVWEYVCAHAEPYDLVWNVY
jgi:hypothetical protein